MGVGAGMEMTWARLDVVNHTIKPALKILCGGRKSY